MNISTDLLHMVSHHRHWFSVGTFFWFIQLLCSNQRSDTWVLGVGCSGVARDRNFWNPKSSKSAKKYYYKLMSKFQLQYGGGSIVNGDLFTDNVTVGGFTVCVTSLTMSLTSD
jgi:hypothetical protein